MILDKLENADLYYDIVPGLERFIQFFNDNDLEVFPACKVRLDGDDLFINVIDLQGKDEKDLPMEAHRDYIDIQLPLTGSETMGWKPQEDCQQVSKDYDDAEVHIPTVNIVHIDFTPKDEILVYGDFWIENYNVEGDTLKCASGGHYPGMMQVSKDYVVTDFKQAADGEDFDSSAKEIFGDYYDDFMKIYSDSDLRNELRKVTVTDYVNLNGLSVTKFQDEGWDPVEIYH